MDIDEDLEADLVVVVVECEKRDSQTDSTIIYIDIVQLDFFYFQFRKMCFCT